MLMKDQICIPERLVTGKYEKSSLVMKQTLLLPQRPSPLFPWPVLICSLLFTELH